MCSWAPILLSAAGLAPALVAQASVSLEPSVASPATVGTLVTWTATVSEAAPDTLWYRFIIRGFDQRPRIVKDFGPDNSFRWAAGEAEGFYAIEVRVRNRDTGEQMEAVAPFQVVSNVTSGQPDVNPTSHPLVWLYSAPPCPLGASMFVYFQAAGAEPGTADALHRTPAKQCNGLFSMNFHIAGIRPATPYHVKHVIEQNSLFSEGPVLQFTSGEAPDHLPVHTVNEGSFSSSNQRVFLAGSLFTNFVATDLEGNLIWYYPEVITFLTRPEPGGYFFGINEDESGDQSKQIVRMFDLEGITVFETNAARINEQLTAAGKRPINAFHHEARRLSNGHILVLAGVEQIMQNVQGSESANILADMIIVLNRNLEVVWTWDAFDHLDVERAAIMDDMCTPGVCPPLFLAPEAKDWLHSNSVAETPDGNLLLSIRSQDWVIKIDYQNGQGTGNVLWRLGKDGDFRIDSSDPDPWFSHQHDAEYESDGTLTIFDNSNVRQAANPEANSRGQVYRLDEQNRVAELVMNADLGYYAFALGSAQRLENGNYLFDAGFLLDGAGISLETDANGNTVHAIKSSAPEYRTFRLKDMYTP